MVVLAIPTSTCPAPFFKIGTDCLNYITAPGLKDYFGSQYYCFMNGGKSVQTYDSSGKDTNLCESFFLIELRPRAFFKKLVTPLVDLSFLISGYISHV